MKRLHRPGSQTDGSKKRGIHTGGGFAQNIHAPDRTSNTGKCLGMTKRSRYFLQITDARADTGGLSGVLRGEAEAGKESTPIVYPNACMVRRSTIALPLIRPILWPKHSPRKSKRHLRQTRRIVDDDLKNMKHRPGVRWRVRF